MKQPPSQQGERAAAACPLPEYPRPQMRRESYLCLNGTWRYAITKTDTPPRRWDGDIVVPFCPESRLSGVRRRVGPEDYLWYSRSFKLPKGFKKDRVLLHFGAVDQCCVVWVNGKEAGRHEGGYLPFALDITGLLQRGEQELRVMAMDETEQGPYSRGRQRLQNGGGPWHSPQSGIWQTVWLESVPKDYIKNLVFVPRYDAGEIEVLAESGGEKTAGEVQVFARSTLVTTAQMETGTPVRLKLPGALSWTPQRPFLYTVKVTAGKDAVEGYFGMRKIALGEDEKGKTRIFLNNRPFAGAGVVDQGFFGDSLYTPPSDAAMEEDIRFARDCGFNMIRKHGKIEPMRWYHHCDRLGMLVWQDIPAGGEERKLSVWERVFGRPKARNDAFYRQFGRESTEGRRLFEKELEGAVQLLRSTPCLGVWVLFQKGQGQFDAARLAEKVKRMDPQRLVDHASGRYDQGGGDIQSLHLKPDEGLTSDKIPGPNGRAAALTEVGHLHHAMPGFAGSVLWIEGRYETKKAYAYAMTALYQNQVVPAMRTGYSGFFLYQLADAEDEADGILTQDRRTQKLGSKGLAMLNAIALGNGPA